MSGHSKWATIKRKKGAADAKRGAQFTKAAKEITVAAREGGGDPDGNARLRSAILAAKAMNVPNANIERAIKRGTGEIEGASYEEVTYEGYGAGGVAFFVTGLTDKKTRTFPEVRKIFEKCGGSLGKDGSVAFLFEQKGVIVVGADAASEDRLLEIVLEAGAEDMQRQDDGAFEITCEPGSYLAVREALESASVPTLSGQVAMVPTTTTRVEGKEAEQVLRLTEMLEDHEDIQDVWSNFDIDDATMAELSS